MTVAFPRLSAEGPAPGRDVPPDATQGDAAVAFGPFLASLLQPQPAPPAPEGAPAAEPAPPLAAEGGEVPPQAELRAAFPPAATARLAEMALSVDDTTPASGESAPPAGEVVPLLDEPAPRAEPKSGAAYPKSPAAAEAAEPAGAARVMAPGAREMPPAAGVPAENTPRPAAESPQPAPPAQVTPAEAPREAVRQQPAPHPHSPTHTAPAEAAADVRAVENLVSEAAVPMGRFARVPEPGRAAPSARVEAAPARAEDTSVSPLARTPVPQAPDATAAPMPETQVVPAADRLAVAQTGEQIVPLPDAETGEDAPAPAAVSVEEAAVSGTDSESGAGAGEREQMPGRRETPQGPAATLASDDSGTNVRPAGKDVRFEQAPEEGAQKPIPASDDAVPQQPERLAPPASGGVEIGLSADAEPAASLPAPAAPADAPAPPSRAETPRAPLSTAISERWQADLQGLVTELRTEAGGWQRLRLRLDDEGGTVTLRARREDDRVAVTVAFSDPALRQVAQASAERLHAALETQLGQQVAFSFDGGGDAQQHAATGDRASASPAPSSPSTSEPERNATLPRRTATGRREWIG